MNVQIRTLRADDTSRVAEIEKEAFPTLWPPTPLKRELSNRMARYLVAWEPKQAEAWPEGKRGPQELGSSHSGSLVGRLINNVKGHLQSGKTLPEADYCILGFVGLWFMAGEAHITAIAVEEASRGKGIGELLLIGSIELAKRQGATEVSLEARASNHVAQSLYRKYGFQNVGTRRAYYVDDREDAVIMTTQPINTPAYLEKLRVLKEAFYQRHGEIRIVLA